MARERRRTSPVVFLTTLYTCMAGGLVIAWSWAVHWPLVEVIAVVVVLVGAVVLGVYGFVEGRASGRGFWRSIGRGLRTFFGALWEFLFP